MTEEAMSAERRRRLVKELVELRKRGIVRIRSNKHEPQDFSLIEEIAQSYAGDGEDLVSALESLFRNAIANMTPGVMRELATIIFGFHSDITDAQPIKWHKEALALFPFVGSDAYREKQETEALNLLAAEIEAISASKMSSGAQLHTREDPGFVHEILDPESSSRLVRKLLPSIDQQDRMRIYLLLGGQRRAIEQACKYLAENSDISVQDFCYMTVRDPELIMEAIAEASERPLNFVYRSLIAKLTDEDPRALEVLQLLAFLPSSFVPAEYIMSYLLGQTLIEKKDLSLALMAFNKAMLPLRKYEFVKMDDYKIMMNPLTQEILRSVFRSRIDNVFEKARPLFAIEDPLCFLEHGWGGYTIAGREVANFVLWVRFKDRKYNRSILERQGKLGGPAWTELIHWRIWGEAKWRNFGAWLSLWNSTAKKRIAEEKVGGFSVFDVEFSEMGLQPLQIAEINDMKDDGAIPKSTARRHFQRTLDRQVGEDNDATKAERQDRISENMAELRKLTIGRFIETDIGKLDYAQIDPTWIDGGGELVRPDLCHPGRILEEIDQLDKKKAKD
ncbi:hypothetical protein BTM25_24240 [Actinomadura rubteroloni]|uniref:Uncharacterized protein n=1 Tax=Actinomadura rubteroloni TaxID=1926885 RepID=A0A2P4UFK9_9ACTN|nr:hypothetical protein [Actinomadura rubteroloni]POM23798.1 hypothetical protein BTM25_24240 [Actinomadura rubteroloni]